MNNIFRLRRNSLQLKILSIFFVGFIVLSSGLTYLSISNNRRLNVLYNDRLNEETAALKKIIQTDSKLSEALASDYSVWDDPYNYLNGKNPNWTQEDLKHKVGDQLKSDDTYKKMLDVEGRRCWGDITHRSTERFALLVRFATGPSVDWGC